MCLRGIRRELVPGIHHRAAGCPIPHRVIREGLRRGEQGMGGRRQPIQPIIPKRLRSSPIRQARAIADIVVDIVRLVDLRAGRDDLVQDVGHLRGRIVGVGGCHLIDGSVGE